MSNVHITCPYENCPEKQFLLKNLESVSDIERKINALSLKISRRCCENFISLQAFVFPKKLCFFVSRLDFEQKHFGLLSKVFHEGCQKFILLLHRNNLRENNFFQKKIVFSHHFRTISETFSSFCRKVFSGVVKSSFYVSLGKFWRKILFEYNPFFDAFRKLSSKISAFW